MIDVGSDPGKKGWIAWIDSDSGKPIGCAPQPVIGQGKGDTYDRQGMVRLVRRLESDHGIRHWLIEEQSAVGGGKLKNVVSLSTQMMSYGSWLGILAALEIPHSEIAPRSWRRYLDIPQPRYPKEKALTKGATKAERAAWEKRDRARVQRQRKEGLERAIRRAQEEFPGVDLRRNERCRVPSDDKAIAHLLALVSHQVGGAVGRRPVVKKKATSKKAKKTRAQQKVIDDIRETRRSIKDAKKQRADISCFDLDPCEWRDK